ncbi:MAG: sulfatase-like hydrolase/transferase [Actinomycetes bacterium]
MKDASDTPSESSALPDGGLGRRQVLVGAAAVAAAAIAAPRMKSQANVAAKSSEDSKGGHPHAGKPNILLVMVDELRFPKVFPTGINSAAEFLAAFMPNTYTLWQRGVKFSQHHSASNDCSPSRGVFFTGLYSQQSWFTTTIIDDPTSTTSSSPVLNRRVPTFGKLVRLAGYKTPYIGKWHLSLPHSTQPGTANSLEQYGFEGMTSPDPTGYNLQGTYGGPSGYLSDNDVKDQAVSWLNATKPTDQPWCLTVGFVNPHDKEFFPAGTEFETFAGLFADSSKNPTGLQQYQAFATLPSASAVNWADNVLKSPPSYGYPTIPDNWESLATLQANKPSYQAVARWFQASAWGGVSDVSTETEFSVVQYPQNPEYPLPIRGVGIAPYSYWQRSLDCYTQIMEIIDVRIGAVLNAMPPAVADNTIVIFTSDHGDFGGAHGLVSGKTGTFYDEAVRVPLIVFDPTGQFTGDVDTIRTGLTSHVDMTPLITSLVHGGSTSWMKGELKTIYGTRHDMVPMLRSAKAPGRRYAMHSNDEVVAPQGNFSNSPWHLTGVVTPKGKFSLYSFWNGTDVKIDPQGAETEYYDYSTRGGQLELDSTPSSRAARDALLALRRDLIPNELRRPLPRTYWIPQEESRLATQAFYALILDSASGN